MIPCGFCRHTFFSFTHIPPSHGETHSLPTKETPFPFPHIRSLVWVYVDVLVHGCQKSVLDVLLRKLYSLVLEKVVSMAWDLPKRLGSLVSCHWSSYLCLNVWLTSLGFFLPCILGLKWGLHVCKIITLPNEQYSWLSCILVKLKEKKITRKQQIICNL